ncbi:MAG: hypothetical protein JWM99_1443 [Verrucomicrobiales bacterium]|nr:hypothetical protein [Verrucomicrobiales bacterium]
MALVAFGVSLFPIQCNGDSDDADIGSLWTRTFDFRTGAGYKDNVLLGHYQKEGSGFWFGGVDIFILRIPVDGTQVSLFLSADDKRYFSTPAIDHEDLALLNFEVKRDLTHGWNAGAGVQYLYQDQLFDTSISETNREVIPVVGHAFQLTPFVRKDLPGRFFVEGRLQMLRQYLQQPLDDYWQGGAKGIVGRQFGYASEVAISYEYHQLRYDSRLAVDFEARSLPDRVLAEGQQEGEFSLKYYWDPARKWRTWTRLGYQENRDNGGGFFDYRRYAASQQLLFKEGRWELQTGVRWRYYDYLVQKVDFNNSNHRRLTLIDSNIRLEVKLGKSWKQFSEFEHESSISRQLLDDFQVNTISTGVEFEF